MSSFVDLPDARLEWVCAYSQSLCLLDQYDAEGLHCAKMIADVWPKTSWGRFFYTYKLTGAYNASIRNKHEAIFTALAPLFNPLYRCTMRLQN